MLSRTADNLYWLSRYVERAEYLARILDATQRLSALPLAYVGASNEWESAVLTAGCAAALGLAAFLALRLLILASARLKETESGPSTGNDKLLWRLLLEGARASVKEFRT